MSYKNVVLNDHPTSFYLLDEVRSGSVGSYNSLTSTFSTYADLRDRGVSYSALSGLPVYDYSGNINDGYAMDTSTKELMPIISGGVRGTQILSDTVVHYLPRGIANQYNKDDSFTIEAWCVLPPTQIDITILGDTSIGTGLFYKNGNIVFKVGPNEIQHAASNSQALYLVGIFQGTSISLYINGTLVEKLSLDNYQFLNEALDFKTGPANGKFVIDCVAFYKFNLSDNQIKKHYAEGTKEINISQIVNVDGGYLFSMNAISIPHNFRFVYPQSRSWGEVAKDGIEISEDGSYLYFPKTNESVPAEYSFTDSFVVPNHSTISSSQIYWDSDLPGIKVEVSIDGSIWKECKNGSPIPYYNKNDNQPASVLYIRVTMSSYDTSKYYIELKSIEILFYGSKDFYSDNSGYSLSSSFDYSLPKYNSTTLSYNKNNGLRMYDGHGFTLNNVPPIKAVEMIFTPESGENVLVSAASKIYEWSATGSISKTAVSSIYVNGINRTSETNIFDFMSIGMPHHVVVNFTSAATNIKFNQNQTDSKSGINSMYNNLAIYQDNMSSNQISQHYLLYTGNITKTINDTQLTISEASTGNDFTSFTLTSVEPEAVSI